MKVTKLVLASLLATTAEAIMTEPFNNDEVLKTANALSASQEKLSAKNAEVKKNEESIAALNWNEDEAKKTKESCAAGAANARQAESI